MLSSGPYGLNGLYSSPARPQKGFSLFAPSGNLKGDAIIGHDPDFGRDMYCSGYKQAADVLVDRFLERHNNYSAEYDSQAYPIIFLYRHYLELRLKELLIAYGRLLCESVNVKGYSHYLVRVWQAIRNMENRVSTKYVPEVYENLEVLQGIIAEFDRIDPTSEAFRYPTYGKTAILPMIQVDLQMLKQAMCWVSCVLDEWSIGVDEYIKAGYEEFEPKDLATH